MSTETKRCSKCGRDLLREGFAPGERKRKSARCRECVREYDRRRHQGENRDAILERRRQWHAENRDAILERKRRHHAENRDAIGERKRRHYAENRDAIHARSYRGENRDAILEYQREAERRRRAERPRAHKSWTGMIQRCTNPNTPGYEYYGGRGITVCAGWATFADFLADMGERPEGTSIDRIDNDGGYWCGHCPACVAAERPANCRWATASEQQRNKRKPKTADQDAA